MTDVEELLRQAMHEQDPHLALPPDAAARALGAQMRHRRRIAGAVVGLAAVVAIAGGVAVAARPTHPQTPTTAPALVVTQSARDQAVAETRRLLDLAPIPPSATSLAHAPAALPGPVLGVPNTTALVISTRVLRVPLSADASASYLRLHPPAGLTQEAGGTASGSGGSFFGIVYGAPDSAAWTGAQLEIGVAALDEHSSAWRIDGLAVVVDQKPLPDDGRRTRDGT